MMDADGLALHDPGGTTLFGATPAGEAVQRLVAILRAGSDGELFETDHLGGLLPEAAAYADVASGVLAVPLDPAHRGMLLWFRREEPRRTIWAGEPGGYIESGADGPQPAPRASFAAWVEEHRGRSRPWTEHERRVAVEVRTFVLDVVVERAIDVARLNRELSRRNAELARSNEELDLFASVVSHDLKSPLRAINALAYGLQEDMAPFLTEESRQDLESIGSRTKHLGAMLDDLLRYARLDRGAANRAELIGLPGLVRDVTALVAAPPGLRIEVACAVPEIVGDRGALQLVLLNLIQNAIEHHDREVGLIEVRAEERGERVLITIADDGPGIPAERRAAMFRPFGAHAAKRGGGEGSGLGLAMVRRCVEQRRGTVIVEGREDSSRGTTVRFSWPRRPPPFAPEG
jgi:light-regulated signal transduction histidine kinase (bacteriophytochrome)